jgi:hypothetical protein
MLKLTDILDSYPLSAVARQEIYEAVDAAIKLGIEHEVDRLKESWINDLNRRNNWIDEVINKLDQFLDERCDAEFAELREDIAAVQEQERAVVGAVH